MVLRMPILAKLSNNSVRARVLAVLRAEQCPITPKEVADITKIRIGAVSVALGALSNAGVILRGEREIVILARGRKFQMWTYRAKIIEGGLNELEEAFRAMVLRTRSKKPMYSNALEQGEHQPHAIDKRQYKDVEGGKALSLAIDDSVPYGKSEIL